MNIVVTGTRGFPEILGGVETHCEELFPRIAAMGHDVTVMRRSPYVNSINDFTEYKGIKFIDVFAPKNKSLEAITHTFLSILKARKLKPDIIHIHAIGPSLLAPFARMLGLKVVVTNHGPDYNRQKWGKFAKTVLRTGERFGTKFANQVIVISNGIADILSAKYGRNDSNLIFNGVTRPVKSKSRTWLNKWGIGRPYIVAMGRFVKEKGFHDLIEAYVRSGLRNKYSFVIAGDSDHPDEYSENLKEQAAAAGVILTGFIKGESLNQLMTNASLFVIPSYHEGLPIALLEAMSYDLDILSSDIRPNRLAELNPEDDFFPVGNIEALTDALIRKLSSPQKRVYDLSAYDWNYIAAQTVDVYKKVIDSPITH